MTPVNNQGNPTRPTIPSQLPPGVSVRVSKDGSGYIIDAPQTANPEIYGSSRKTAYPVQGTHLQVINNPNTGKPTFLRITWQSPTISDSTDAVIPAPRFPKIEYADRKGQYRDLDALKEGGAFASHYRGFPGVDISE
jgi:hypothetical protein